MKRKITIGLLAVLLYGVFFSVLLAENHLGIISKPLNFFAQFKNTHSRTLMESVDTVTIAGNSNNLNERSIIPAGNEKRGNLHIKKHRIKNELMDKLNKFKGLPSEDDTQKKERVALSHTEIARILKDKGIGVKTPISSEDRLQKDSSNESKKFSLTEKEVREKMKHKNVFGKEMTYDEKMKIFKENLTESEYNKIENSMKGTNSVSPFTKEEEEDMKKRLKEKIKDDDVYKSLFPPTTVIIE